MENNFMIVTCGDSNYYKFLKRFENNIYKFYGKYPIVYDLGLTSQQKNNLNSKILKYPIELKGFEKYSKTGFIKAIHKPYIVLDLLENGIDVILLDADMLLTEKLLIKYFDFDIGITPRHPEERYTQLYENGYINSGTLLFKSNLRTISVVKKWIEMCQTSDDSDQLALSKILSKYMSVEKMFENDLVIFDNLKIRCFNAEVYNDVSLSKGKILHYKNAGRFIKAFNRYKFEYYLIKCNMPYRNILGKIYNKL